MRYNNTTYRFCLRGGVAFTTPDPLHFFVKFRQNTCKKSHFMLH